MRKRCVLGGGRGTFTTELFTQYHPCAGHAPWLGKTPQAVMSRVARVEKMEQYCPLVEVDPGVLGSGGRAVVCSGLHIEIFGTVVLPSGRGHFNSTATPKVY